VIPFLASGNFGALPRDRLNWHRLQRLDFHLAEFHDARGILKRERPTSVLAVLNIHRAGSVERHGKLRAFRRDLIGVPSTTGFGHRRYFGHVDDGSRAVIRLGALVVDLHLIASCGAGFLRIGTAYEDAAVGI
jgi:hypothetical protein